MRNIVDAVKQAGITAVIASDVAAMMYAVERDVEVHMSTQLNISNVEALKFYARFADVVVLARELNLDQVYHIYRAIEEQQIRGRRGRFGEDRDVLPWSVVYGCLGEVLSEPAREKSLGKQRQLQSDMPSELYGQRYIVGYRIGGRQPIYNVAQRP